MDRLKTSDRFQEYHREMIVKKREEVLKELNRELNERVNQSSELRSALGSDLGDLSTLSLDSDLSASLATRYSNMLKQFDEALEKVEEGTYGICEECGEKIDGRRLEIVPSTLYCAPCQERMEKENSGRPNYSKDISTS